MTDASFFLRDAETSLRMLVENTSDILWINGPDGTCEWVSPSVQTALGYDPTTLVGTRTSIIHPDDRDAATLAIQKAMDRHETNRRAQVRVLTTDGDIRWMDLSTDLWWTPENRLLRTVSSMRDITAQKLAEAALAESERRHRTLAENLTEVACRATVDGTLQWVSPSVEDVLGWEPSDVVGRALWDLVHPDDYHTAREARRHLAEDKTCSMVVRLSARDGDHRWIELRLTRVDEGDHHTLVGTWTDVDAEHRAVAELAASEQQFRGAMQAASIGMCLVAPNGSFLAVNPALCELLDRDEEALTSSTWQELTHPDDVAADAALVQEMLDGRRESYRLLKRYLRPDGKIIWGDLSVSCVRDADGSVRHFVSQITDLTARVEAEQKQAEAEEHYRVVAEYASDFVMRLDADNRIVWASPTIRKRLGHLPADMIGPLRVDLMHPQDQWKVPAAIGALRSGSDVVSQDARLRHRDGTYTWWNFTARRAEDASDPTIVVSFHDIDSEVRARAALKASEERYQALLQNIQDIVVATDPKGLITFASPAVTELLGWEADELVGVPVLSLVHPEDRESVTQVREDESAPYLARVRRQDGTYVWLQAKRKTLRSDDGTVMGGVAVWRDAMDLVDRENARTREAARLTAITDNIADLVLRLNHGVVQWASPSIASYLGGTAEQWVGFNMRRLVHPDDQAVIDDVDSRLPTEHSAKLRIRIRDPRHVYHWFEAVASMPSPATSDDIIVSLRLVDDEVAHEADLVRMAGTDSLTGLPNRRELHHQVSHILQRRRRGNRTAILFCDVDNLKQINDQHGHQVGDAVLVVVADRIRRLVRAEDVAARIGGDELVVVLTGLHTLRQAEQIAEKVRAAVAAPLVLPRVGQIPVTVSVGVALARPHEDVDHLLGRADAAMYTAKQAGRNRVASD
ncbi:MAG: PAS domain S-box protein [Candidatus Nanopelagicales bacterium]